MAGSFGVPPHPYLDLVNTNLKLSSNSEPIVHSSPNVLWTAHSLSQWKCAESQSDSSTVQDPEARGLKSAPKKKKKGWKEK